METSRLSRFLLEKTMHLAWTLIEMFHLPFPPFPTGSCVIFERSQSLGQALLSPEEPWGCVQCLPCLLSLQIPESPCDPLPFAARDLSSALEGHGPNELLYFVRQALPPSLLILLQSPDELGEKTAKGKKMDQREKSVRGRGWERWAARCEQLQVGRCEIPIDSKATWLSLVCWTPRFPLNKTRSGALDSTFLVSFSRKVMRFFNPNGKIAVALYHKWLHAVQ